MKFLKTRLRCTADLDNYEVQFKKNNYYVFFDKESVLMSFNNFKYIYLDEIATVFLRAIMKYKNLEESYKEILKLFHYDSGNIEDEYSTKEDFISWCNSMINNNTIKIKLV